MTVNDEGENFKYDAWNRLHERDDQSTNFSYSQAYEYDALGRRVTDTNSGNGQTTAHFYHSRDWQVIEEHGDVEEDGVWTVEQYVWSPVYVDALVLRDRDEDEDDQTGNLGLSGSGLEERLYVQQDANFNVTAITNAAGAVQERYVYDPYGAFTALKADWTARPNGRGAFSWVYLHQGGRYDRYSDTYHFRNREYDPTLGRWMQQDPAGYVDGASLYRAMSDNPVRFRDPLGLMPNQENAITRERLKNTIQSLERRAENRCKNACEMLDVMTDYMKQEGSWKGIGKPGSQWKYIHTRETGWIDLPHFFETAQLTGDNGMRPEVVDWGSDRFENLQAGGQRIYKATGLMSPGFGASAHGVEDYDSSDLGNWFGQNVDCSKPLSDQIDELMSELGATKPQEAPNWWALPKTEGQWVNEFYNQPGTAKARVLAYRNPGLYYSLRSFLSSRPVPATGLGSSGSPAVFGRPTGPVRPEWFGAGP